MSRSRKHQRRSIPGFGSKARGLGSPSDGLGGRSNITARLRSSCEREKHQRAHLDALPLRSTGCQRIVERSVKRDPRATVVRAVMDANEDYLVGLHELWPEVGDGVTG